MSGLTLTVNSAEDSSLPISLLTTTLYVPENSTVDEVMESFISIPLNEILTSLDAFITVEFLGIEIKK